MNHESPHNILLSICLPTYNQPEEVSAFLKSVVPQLTEEVEVVIWDDSPARATEEAIKKYTEKGCIRYFRGVESGLKGIDYAVIGLLKEAKGKYAWTFGDEILEAGAIARVLSLLKEYPDLALIWVNSRSQECDAVAVDFGGDKFFRDADEVLEQIGTELSFISATIFNRAKALQGAASAEKYISTTFVHIYFVLTAISRGGRYYLLHHPYVVSPTKGDAFNFNFNKDVFKVYADDLYRIMTSTDFKGRLGRRAIRKALAVQLGGLWRGILVARARGITANLGSSSPKIPLLLKHFWSYPETWIAVPLLLLPHSIDRVLYRIYKKIFRRTRAPRHVWKGH